MGSDWVFNEVRKRFTEESMSLNGKSLLIIRNGASLNGEYISGYTISKDKKWACIPVHDEAAEVFTGQYEYSPKCFEIDYECTTYISNGTLSVLTNIYVLNN